MSHLSIDNIKLFKGAPLAVLFLLFFCPEPVSQAWLERWSGYSDKSITQACRLLKEMRLIIATLDGWVLVDDIFLPQHPRRNSGSIITIINPDINNLEKEENNNKSPRKNSGYQNGQNAPLTATLPPESPEKSEMWQILREAGFYRNSRMHDLLNMPHMTPAYLRAKLEELKDSNQNNPRWIGLAIGVLESGEPIGPRAKNGHLLTCQCPQCAVRRFLPGLD